MRNDEAGDDPFHRPAHRSRPARPARREARALFSWSDTRWPLSLGGGIHVAVPRALWIGAACLCGAALVAWAVVAAAS